MYRISSRPDILLTKKEKRMTHTPLYMKPLPLHTRIQATTSLEGGEGTGQLSKGNHWKQKAGGCILLSGV